MLIATVIAEGKDEVLRQARKAAAYADGVEFRLDRMPGLIDDLPGLVSRLPVPAVATCRRADDGGCFTGGEEERLELLRRAAQNGAAWIDLEWGSQVERLADERVPARVLLSHHDHEGTPEDLDTVCHALGSRPNVDMIKLVTRAADLGDNLRIRDLLHDHHGPVPLAAFCLGSAGVLSRVLSLAWGSAAIYGSAGGAPAAPGQLSVEEMLTCYRLRSLGRKTRVLGVAGFPLGHSLSPSVHNAAFASLGLDAIYVPLDEERLETIISLARKLPLAGLSVTLPHKEAILEHLDSIDPLAERLGAVNTVVMQEDGWAGHNTDAAAGIEPLARRIDLAGCSVALLGAGGAARALAHGLMNRQAEVTVFSRTDARARGLAEEAGFAWRPLVDLETHPYQVLVQATPVGMAPAERALPIPEEWLRGELIYDIIYNPRETALLAAARRRGIATLGGMEMFLAQAAEQFRLFTGQTAPIEAMRSAVGDKEVDGG